MTYTVVLDTCVLYPAYLRDSLLRLAAHGLYRPLWSNQILNELERNLAELDTVGTDRAARIVGLLEEHFADAKVTGYRPLIEVMTNDPADRHVLAAAVRANAAAVVTFNLTDFPERATAPYNLTATHPDEFLCDQLALDPRLVIQTLAEQAGAHSRPPTTLPGLLDALQRAGVPTFADEARSHLPTNEAAQPDPHQGSDSQQQQP